MPTEQYQEVTLLLLVSIAAVNDLATRRIPNRLLLAGLAGATVLDMLSPQPGMALRAAFAGLLVGFVLFLPFYMVRGMAAGDVKMMAVVGAFTGPEDAFAIVILTFCVGGVMALLLVALRGRLRLALRNLGHLLACMVRPRAGSSMALPQESAGSMPYGAAIAIGTIAMLVRHYG
jgi:prepilin peptidase CpaA